MVVNSRDGRTDKRELTVLSLAVLLLLTGCEGGTARPPYAHELQAEAEALQAQADVAREQALAVALEETAEAQSTRSAQDSAARATMDSLSAQATVQALSIVATQQAVSLSATATAQIVSGEATRTAEARNVQATATAAAATATMQAAMSAVEATAQAAQAIAVEATAQAIVRQEERERITQPLRTFGPWVLLLAGLAATGWMGYQLFPILKTKLGQIRRDERGDLPLVALAQGDTIVLFDPTRGWGPATEIIDGNVIQPLLTKPEYQDGTTKRAQFVDWRKGGRPRPVVARSSVNQRPTSKLSPQAEWRDVTPEHEHRWPSRVPLRGILGEQVSYHSLALGVTVHENGRTEVVRADMSRLVHVAVGGSSGWGKSVFLQMLAYQLALSSDPIYLALIDLEGVSFAPFARCGRLLYPIADTEQDTLAILQALTEELDRRKELYSRHPGVANLDQYNSQAAEPLAPTVALFDEATALLDNKRIEGMIKTLVLRARKYGLWCVLGGQDWRASSLDTAIRNQLSSRFQFKAMSASQSRVLLQRSGAEALNVQGRALAILPGRDIIELQAPMVGYSAIEAELTDGGPRHTLPEVTNIDGHDAIKMNEVLRLKEEGASDTRIAREVFGYGNTFYIEKVRDILRQQQHAETI